MVDEEIQDVSAGPTGAPVNRDARREPEVIEGEIAARESDDSGSPPGSATAENGADPRRAPTPRTDIRSLLAGALGGLIVSALGLGAGYTLLASKADVSESANRLSALETQARQSNEAIVAEANRESAAVANLEKRIGALEASAGASSAADLDKRVMALEAASAASGAASEATQRLAAQAKDLRADVDAEKREVPELSARVAKLESDAPKANAAGPDLAALAARVDKIEGALSAPKSETRAAAEKPAAADDATAIAIIAEVAEERLRSGAGFGPELAALQRLGVDSAALAPLQAVVNGAPTNGALAASFSAVAPHVLAATAPAEQGSVTDRFLAHLHNLVRVRELNETAGDHPQALVSQIEAGSRRGDIGAALASFDKLPEAARKAAGDWPTLARARQAAEAALQSIREAAVVRLAGGPKP
ncbi:MAG TPA: hypothetical protein VGL12_12935 [Roseiarcus sp.]